MKIATNHFNISYIQSMILNRSRESNEKKILIQYKLIKTVFITISITK